MSKLDINFNKILPHVAYAFTRVYGDEYESIIRERVWNALINYYYNIEGLEDYIEFIKSCKGREYSIKFLEEIGVDVQKYKKDNYTASLDNDVTEILDHLIDSTWDLSELDDLFSPLRAFYLSNSDDSEILLENKLKVMNFLLDNSHELITEENFDDFTRTKEYSELMKTIDKYNMIYERLLSEYNNWLTKLKPYESDIEDKKKRKASLLQEKKSEMFEEIFMKLPLSVRECISNKTLKQQQEIILGSLDLAYIYDIESFGRKQMEKLKSTDVHPEDKILIIHKQSEYLKKLGITISDESMLDCETEEDVIKYLNFLKQDSVRDYVPSEELASDISSARKRKYEEALKEYYITSEDFITIMNMFKNDSKIFEYVYQNIKNKRVGVLGQVGTSDNNESISIMFFSIRDGYILYSFMHEMGHVIDQNQKGIGFEAISDYGKNGNTNSYNKNYRKYEKFNEALNDIFTSEAVGVLQNEGIYLITPKEFTPLDISNCNTVSIVRNLLQPLIQKFRKQVIQAKINVNPEELIKYIGEDNFEQLVDVVNKVDSLIRNKVMSKINKFPKDLMVIEYHEQFERIKQIYINIDAYYASNFEDPSRKKL